MQLLIYSTSWFQLSHSEFFFIILVHTYAEMVSLSDFDQQQNHQQLDAVSTINNKHYQFHSEYDENLFSENDNGGDTMQSALNRGPYFDTSVSRNVTALVGSTAYLNCRVRNLGNKTVCIFFCCCWRWQWLLLSCCGKSQKYMICGCCIAGQLDET